MSVLTVKSSRVSDYLETYSDHVLIKKNAVIVFKIKVHSTLLFVSVLLYQTFNTANDRT